MISMLALAVSMALPLYLARRQDPKTRVAGGQGLLFDEDGFMACEHGQGEVYRLVVTNFGRSQIRVVDWQFLSAESPGWGVSAHGIKRSLGPPAFSVLEPRGQLSFLMNRCEVDQFLDRNPLTNSTTRLIPSVDLSDGQRVVGRSFPRNPSATVELQKVKRRQHSRWRRALFPNRHRHPSLWDW